MLVPRLSEVNLYSESQVVEFDVDFDTIFGQKSTDTIMSNCEIMESQCDIEKSTLPFCGKRATNLFEDLTTLSMPASLP